MPPEQILAQRVDAGADIFALGVILYEVLAGVPPIEAETATAYHQLNVDVTPTPLRQRRPELPESLERLLGRMMAKRRVDRPPSMADVAARLHAIAAEAGWLAESRAVARSSATTQDLRREALSSLPQPRRWRVVAAMIAGVVIGIAGAMGAGVVTRGASTTPAPAAFPVVALRSGIASSGNPLFPAPALPVMSRSGSSARAATSQPALPAAMSQPVSRRSGTALTRATPTTGPRYSAAKGRPARQRRAPGGWGEALGGL